MGVCGFDSVCVLRVFFFLVDSQVTENEKVSTVKELVFERLKIPPHQQRLLYKGKALAGTNKEWSRSKFFSFKLSLPLSLR